ncbi:MAG: DUF3347 domain-containing protein [Chitinophagales bacterium]|nr:DUF3347 domain-containing protein [Chitinophagales bacterium]
MKAQILIIIVSALIGAGACGQSTNHSPLPEYLSAYMQLKDALYYEDVSKVKEAATDLKIKIGKAELSDAKRVESINSVLIAIASGNDLEEQRKSFAKLSQYMITEVENSSLISITLYSDFCPMARDGKGAYWLSTEKAINNNPYMGPKMPHCGSVDQKISK